MRRQFVVVALVAMALAACGTPGATAPTPSSIPEITVTAAPSAAAPTATVATLAPTVTPLPATPAASPEPGVGTVLPAALLYVSGDGQVVRLERDAQRASTLTAEQAPVFELAVASDGSLAYLTIGADGVETVLVHSAADGTQRSELARGIMRGLVAIPSGPSIQVGVLGATSTSAGDGLASGVWSFPLDGGAPALRQPARDPSASAPGTHYAPIAWSDDGARLLLRTSPNNGPDQPAGDISSTGVALYDAAARRTSDVVPPGSQRLCLDGALDASGTTLFCAASQYLGAETPALWSVDIASGAAHELVPISGAGGINVVAGPRVLGGRLYTLAAQTSEQAVELPAFTAQRTALDGVSDREQLLADPIEAGYDGGLWAPDGSGIVAGRPAAGGNRTIIWHPFDGSGPVELASGSIGALRWASR
jgi:hypothetical protein